MSGGDARRLETLSGEPRLAFLAGREALLTAASRLGAPPEAVVEAECPDCGESHGRPRVEGAGERIHLALTHARGRAFAIASLRPVGIDAESLDAPAARIAAIDDLVPGRRSALHRWTAAEAVLKADGRGLRVDPALVGLGRSAAVLCEVRYRVSTLRLEGCRVTVATRLTGRMSVAAQRA